MKTTKLYHAQSEAVKRDAGNATMTANVISIPWQEHTLQAGRKGVVRPANRPARFWFTPSDMTEEEESIERNYGFLVSSNEFKFTA